jgi:hypothetical protein
MRHHHDRRSWRGKLSSARSARGWSARRCSPPPPPLAAEADGVYSAARPMDFFGFLILGGSLGLLDLGPPLCARWVTGSLGSCCSSAERGTHQVCIHGICTPNDANSPVSIQDDRGLSQRGATPSSRPAAGRDVHCAARAALLLLAHCKHGFIPEAPCCSGTGQHSTPSLAACAKRDMSASKRSEGPRIQGPELRLDRHSKPSGGYAIRACARSYSQR